MNVFWISWLHYHPLYVANVAKFFEEQISFLSKDEQALMPVCGWSIWKFLLGEIDGYVTPAEMWAENKIDPGTLAWLSRN